MKQPIYLVIFLVIFGLVFTQVRNPTTALADGPEIKPVVVYADAFAESDTLYELVPPPSKVPAPGVSAFNASQDVPAEGEVVEIPTFPLPKGDLVYPEAELGGETLLGAESTQAEAPATLDMPSPLVSFDGLSSQDNLNAFGFLLSPPDTNGDVGPNHYVEMINLLVRVYDKAGNPLTAPFKLSTLFAPLGGQCSAQDRGDPIVLYDPLADRWLLSQFAFTGTSTPPYHECIAISKTGDPTGSYYLYDFITPGNEFPDYPKLGVWPDGYYMTVNQFLLGGSFDGTGVYAFNRTKMLAGDPTASLIYYNLNLASHPEAIGGMLPSDFDGLIPPPPGKPNTFAYFIATEFGDAIDGLRLFDFHVDFANPLNSTFTERPESPLAVAAFNPLTPSGRDDILQPPPATSSAALDAIADRLMHRLQYRNTGTQEWLVTNHTVNVSGSTVLGVYRSGVRYYQLSSSGGAFSIAEQATFDPADGNNRWMGSAAVDHQGNLAVGYSVSSLTTFPSIRYAGRLATDLPGGLFQGETTLVAGTGVQTNTGSRWGDYSSLSVDPVDDCTFWHANEYYTAASQASSSVGWLTRIGSFVFPNCTPAPQGALQGVVTDAATGNPINGALVQFSSGFSRMTDPAGLYTLNLAPITDTVTVSKFGYLSASVEVTIQDGVTTVQDFALIGLPVVNAAGAALVSEGFSPPNGVIDSAETVSVDFGLLNVGAGATTNLVATLLPTGGVLNPSGPATYGVIPASGGSGAQTFTFRADPALGCGGALVATLHLQDGANDLGNVTFTFRLGSPRTALAESFDGVVAPALPANWVATVAAGLSTNNWRSVTTSPDTAPNTMFVPDPSTVHDVRLDTPVFAVQSASAQLTFRNNYNTEAGFDGGVLEISLNGGSFVDILAAGGSFVSGGYNRTLSTGFSNPLPGRQAWSGNSNGYITTVVNLPAAAAGANVQLRWRFGSDSSVSATGWRVDSVSVGDGFACVYDLRPDGATIVNESFTPLNNAADPGEALRVSFGLRNHGTQPTTDLVATLLPSGGVLNPSGAQSYGALGAGAQPYVFRADPALGCGGALVATLHLQDGATDLGNVTYAFTLGTLDVSLAESFDGVVAPGLPANWVATVAAGLSTNNWRSVTTSPDSAPNTMFVPDPSTVHDVRLDTPVFAVQSASAQLTFRNNYNTEAGFDGGVLEISLNGGSFVDILAGGGSFVSGGYNRTLSTGFSNPLPGRQAWSGNSNGYITTVVNLPAAAAGANVQLRWRLGSDSSVSGTGWRIDSVSVIGGYACSANAAPVVSVAPASQSVQYSDPAAATITGDDAALDTPLAISTEWNVDGGSFVAGLPGWLSLSDNGCTTSGNSGSCTWTLSGNALTAPGAYVVRATVSDSLGASSSSDITIIVVQEDARVTYTGSLFVSTASTTSSSANVTLAATVQDISVTPDAAGDVYPGDIRNARLTFINRDTNTPIAGCINLPVGLVNPGDFQTGAATCNWNVTISGDAQNFTIGMVVSNYYTRNHSADNTVVMVVKPLASNFITGGGYLVLSNSVGLKAGDVGSRNNFGFNVKYNRSGRNLQGNLNVIIRVTEADGLHVYQIKGNVMYSLAVQVGPGTATFTGKASIIDITNASSPVSVDGNATFQVTVDDNGEPGSSDTIGITLWNKNGGLWFSSRWNGTNTVEQLLAGGNLVVR